MTLLDSWITRTLYTVKRNLRLFGFLDQCPLSSAWIWDLPRRFCGRPPMLFSLRPRYGAPRSTSPSPLDWAQSQARRSDNRIHPNYCYFLQPSRHQISSSFPGVRGMGWAFHVCPHGCNHLACFSAVPMKSFVWQFTISSPVTNGDLTACARSVIELEALLSTSR